MHVILILVYVNIADTHKYQLTVNQNINDLAVLGIVIAADQCYRNMRCAVFCVSRKYCVSFFVEDCQCKLYEFQLSKTAIAQTYDRKFYSLAV